MSGGNGHGDNEQQKKTCAHLHLYIYYKTQMDWPLIGCSSLVIRNRWLLRWPNIWWPYVQCSFMQVCNMDVVVKTNTLHTWYGTVCRYTQRNTHTHTHKHSNEWKLVNGMSTALKMVHCNFANVFPVWAAHQMRSALRGNRSDKTDCCCFTSSDKTKRTISKS